MYQAALGAINVLSTKAYYQRWLTPELIAQAPCGVRYQPWLAGRVLLAITLNDGPLPPLTVGTCGKPRFAAGAQPAFSISHSGDAVALLLTQQGEVGCDIEVIRPRPSYLALAADCFSAEECAWLDAQPEARRLAAFWRLWTAREAVLKQRGDSVWQMTSLVLPPQTLSLPGLFVCQRQWHGLSIAFCGECSFPENSNIINNITTAITPFTRSITR